MSSYPNQGHYNPSGGHAQAYDPLQAAMLNGKTYSSSGGNVAGGDKQDSYMDKFIPFFGLPKEDRFFDPHQEYPRENYQLPEAFRGSRVYMSKLLINMIRRQDVWPITDMLPWKTWNGGTTIAWDVWQFHDGHLGRTPEEAVSRLLTSNFRENRTYIVRWGLAMLLEHGFMNTERGRESYRMGKWQIANATVETLCHGAMLAVLNPNKERFPNMRSSGTASNAYRTKLLQAEVANWGIVHKNENGVDIMLDRMRQNLRANSSTRVEGNLTVFPQGMPKYIRSRPENRYFFLSGRRSAMGANIPESAGSVVRESRGFRIEHNKEAVDPMFQQRTIGTMFSMTDRHLRSIPANEYRTYMMDTDIYSESQDDWVRIRYEKAVQQTGFFFHDQESDKWMLTGYGERYFQETPYWGDYLVKHDVMDRFLEFLYRGIDARRFADFFARFVEAYKGIGIDGDLERNADGIADEVHDQEAKAAGNPATSPFGKGNALVDGKLLGEFTALLGGAIGHGAPIGMGAGPQTDDLKNLRYGMDAGSLNAKLFVAWLTESGLKPKAAEVKVAVDAAADNEVVLPDSFLLTLAAIGKRVLPPQIPQGHPDHAFSVMVEKLFSDSKTMLDPRDVVLSWFDDDGASGRTADSMGLNAAETAALVARSIIHNQVLTIDFAGDAAQTQARFVAYVGKLQTEFKALVPTAAPTDLGKLQSRLFSHLYTSIRVSADLADRSALLDSLRRYDTTIVNAAGHVTAPEAKWTAGTGSTELKRLRFWDPRKAGEVKLHPLSAHMVVPVMTSLSSLSTGGFPATQPPKIGWTLEAAFTNAFGDPARQTAVPNFQGHMQVSGHLADEEKQRRKETRKLAETLSIGDSGRDELESHFRQGAIEQHRRFFNAVPRLYARAPDALHAIYRRRVLATPIVSAASDMANRVIPAEWKSAGMSTTEFVRLMALVEALIPLQPERETPKNTEAEQRAEAERVRHANANAEARVQLLLSEIYHGDKLVDVLGKLKAGYSTLWASTLGLKDWVALATTEKALDSLRKTGDLLAVAMKRIGQKYFVDVASKISNGAMRSYISERALESQDATRGAVASSFSDGREALNFMAGLSGASKGGKLSTVTDDELAKFRDSVSTDTMRQSLHALPANNGELVRWCLRNNMPVLLGILGLRPHSTYVMGAVVHMEAFGAAGYTLQGHHDFQLGDDVQQKMHYGHFTLYAKSVVMDDTLIAHAQDVFYKDYVGGNDHHVWDPMDPDHVQDYREGYMENSIFMCALGPSEYIEVPYLDITGRYHAELGGSPSRKHEYHYSTAPLYCEMWGWRHGQYLLNRPYFDYSHKPQVNTLVFQDHQWLYVHKSKERGGWSHPVINKGHFGDRIYPGCGRTRCGLDMYLRPTKYSDTATISIMV